jgi:hypothetical protein
MSLGAAGCLGWEESDIGGVAGAVGPLAIEEASLTGGFGGIAYAGDVERASGACFWNGFEVVLGGRADGAVVASRVRFENINLLSRDGSWASEYRAAAPSSLAMNADLDVDNGWGSPTLWFEASSGAREDEWTYRSNARTARVDIEALDGVRRRVSVAALFGGEERVTGAFTIQMPQSGD